MSSFSDIINRARKEGETKLKIIAPRYTPPKQTPIPSGGGGSSSRSSGGSSSQPQSTIQTPTPAATAPQSQPPAPTSSGPSATQQRAIQAQQTSTANQRFIQTATGTSTPEQAQQVIQSRNTQRAAIAEKAKQKTSRRLQSVEDTFINKPKIALSVGKKKAEKVVEKVISTDLRMGNIFGLPTGSKVRDVTATIPENLGAVGESIGGQKGQAIGSTSGAVIDILTPKTVGELGLAVGGGMALSKASPVIRATADLTFTGLGTRAALNPELTTPERIAGGIVGATGGLGFVLETAPFIRGGFARFDPKTSSVKTGVEGLPKDVSAITGVRGQQSKLDIAIIPESKGGKIGPAFERGGFGFSSKEQAAFIGQDSTVVSSQIGFLKGGKETVKIDRQFFGTPSDIPTGSPQTRISRLGLTDPFKAPSSDAKFGFLPQRPQILLFENQRIGTNPLTGFRGGGTAKGGGFTSELEVVTLVPITSGGKIGQTVLKGQKVDIFSANLGQGQSPGSASGLTKIKGLDAVSFRGVQTIPIPSTTLPITGVVRTELINTPISTPPPTPTLPTSSLSTPTTGSTPTITSTPVTTISGESSPTPPRGGGSRGGGSPSIPSAPPTSFSPPTSVPSLPTISSTPTRIPSIPRAPPRTPTLTSIPRTPTRFIIPKVTAAPRSPKSFGVQIRRGGKFFSIGNFGTQIQAFRVGRERVGSSLAATFRLTTPGKIPGAPKGFRIKKTNLGNLFIEKRGRRLSTGSETREIRAAKGKKKKKKSTRRKKK